MWTLCFSVWSVQVCNNEATCTCDATWAGTDCSMPDPPKEPESTKEQGPKGRSSPLTTAAPLICRRGASHQLIFASGLKERIKKHHLVCLAWLRWWNEHGSVVHLMQGTGGGALQGNISSITLRHKPAVCFWQGGNNAPFPSAQWAWPLTGW